MPVSGGPDITTDSLVYYVDFSNKKSYNTEEAHANNLYGPSDSSCYIVGSPTYESPGSLYMNGSTDYMYTWRTANSQLNFHDSNWSVEAWFKWRPTATINYHYTVMSDWNTGAALGTNCWLIGATQTSLSTGTIQFTVTGNVTNYAVYANASTQHNTWYNVVAMRNGDTISLYVNGLFQDSLGDSDLNTLTNTINPFYFGTFRGNQTPPGTYSTAKFDGNIAIVKVYKKVLSGKEILQNYYALKTKFGL